jgi:hypothetical protein
MSKRRFSSSLSSTETHRGRKRKASELQILEQKSIGPVSLEFQQYPLREPVDHEFRPYYERFRAGQLIALLEYSSSYRGEEIGASYYELIGRLVTLQSFPEARVLVSEIGRHGYRLIDYRRFYRILLPLCQQARRFIRSRYHEAALKRREQLEQHINRGGSAHGTNVNNRAPDVKEVAAWAEDISINREELWCEYVTQHYCQYTDGGPEDEDEKARSESIRELLELAEKLSPLSDWFSVYALATSFNIHCLVSKPMFFELDASKRGPIERAERDARYRTRREAVTPSSVARKYACVIVRVSLSKVSHRNRRK